MENEALLMKKQLASSLLLLRLMEYGQVGQVGQVGHLAVQVVEAVQQQEQEVVHHQQTVEINVLERVQRAKAAIHNCVIDRLMLARITYEVLHDGSVLERKLII